MMLKKLRRIIWRWFSLLKIMIEIAMKTNFKFQWKTSWHSYTFCPRKYVKFKNFANRPVFRHVCKHICKRNYLVFGSINIRWSIFIGSSNPIQKMKFSIMNFWSKCDQIHRKLRIWSHLLNKSVMKNFIFCSVQYAHSDLLYFSNIN